MRTQKDRVYVVPPVRVETVTRGRFVPPAVRVTVVFPIVYRVDTRMPFFVYRTVLEFIVSSFSWRNTCDADESSGGSSRRPKPLSNDLATDCVALDCRRTVRRAGHAFQCGDSYVEEP